MWNQKLKTLLNRFLDSKDASEIEEYFQEQSQTFTEFEHTKTFTLDPTFSNEILTSMHFESPAQ